MILIIVIKERDEAISKINEQLITIWRAKILIDKKEENKNNIKFCLNPSLDDFEINKVFITGFLKGLWGYPEVVYHILKQSDKKTIESNLGPFIVNNFYCNYLSGNYLENNLLYIISMMLKDEISALYSINQVDIFLENSKCGYLLEQLRRMPDIQIFFKKVIIKTIEKIERASSSGDISLSIANKFTEMSKLIEVEKKKLGVKKKIEMYEIGKKVMNSMLDRTINHFEEEKEEFAKNFIKENNHLFNKYLRALGVEDFQNFAEKAKNENKKDLADFFQEIRNNYQDENYSNTVFLERLDKNKLSPYLLPVYFKDFLEIIPFIEQLIEDLMNNILLLPNSIKYICKIISILIKKQFKNITKSEENAFISKFLIEKLLLPMLLSPSTNAYISEFVISKSTLTNIGNIKRIIKKLFSGKLFSNSIEESDYTPLNMFFMERMEKILYFFEKSKNINLPDFIDKYIKDELPSDYSYEYFNENKEELYASISICFSIDNLYNLIKGLEKNEDLLNNNPRANRLRRSFNKLKNEDTFNLLKSADDAKKAKHLNSYKNSEKNKNKEKSVEIQNFYLYNDHLLENKYENLFLINNKIANFYINIKKLEKNTKLEEKDKNVIKIKNYLCSSLGNYRLLNKSDFTNESKSVAQILNELKLYMSLENFILSNNTIPSVWYINSILDYLNKIPDYYIENDYQKIFAELTQDLNDSINILDFEKLIIFRNKLKFIDKTNNYYDNIKQLINNIVFNDNIKTIVNGMYCPIDIIFRYDKKGKQFELTKSSFKEKQFEDKNIYSIPKKYLTSFRTIEAFTSYFPNLSKKREDTINMLRELKIKEKFDNYFKIIGEALNTQNVNQYKSIYEEKIKDYIMNKIYEKIYPPKPSEKDLKIYKKSLSLSWVEPNLLLNKDYIFDNMLPDILNEFNKINQSKNPFKKLQGFRKIMELIDILIKFNEGIDKEIGAEDITPVLNYVYIKACPTGISTDIDFVRAFLDNNGQYENSLANIESMGDVIINCTPENFNLSQEEFDQRCSLINQSDQ